MKETEHIADQLRRSYYGDAWHGPSLSELLNNVNTEMAKAKPFVGAHSIWELVLHISTWITVAQKRIEGIPFEPTNEEDWKTISDFSDDAWKETRQQLHHSIERLASTISHLDDTILGKITVGNSYSNYVLLHGVVQHNLYHAGQIAQIKKAYTVHDERKILEYSEKGDTEKVKELLQRNPKLVHTKDIFAKTPLHLAAENNHTETAQLLLSANAELECETSWGMTPLAWASNCGAFDVAELLLSRGAKSTMWIFAALGKTEEVESYFQTPTSLKEYAGQSRAVETEKNVWKKLPPSENFTELISDAFCIACRNGKLDVVKFLFERGAEINFKGFFGGTGLHWASINGHKETVEWLLQHHADFQLEDDEFKSTPYLWAKQNSNSEIMELLKQYGAKEE
ncbi:MAG: ankyrin repeat domain-containing protein [Ignavibacteriales bacterium]|nr:ankyrin repeat domain-containing protein [Ignavibacteriales bacterium]